MKPESCTQPTSPFIITEKIPGNSVHNALTNNEISFDTWLLLFAQILLGLEVAQREVNFTHFDLHSGNVMIRTDNDIKYTVLLDTMTYKVHRTRHLPVIIDFGQSSVTMEKNIVGSFDFPFYGMMNFMVPGYDMYKFLCSCASNASDLVRYEIMELFTFYGEDDPYNITNTWSVGIRAAIDEYCSRVTFSKAAVYTPLMFFKMLYAHPKYHKKLEQNIKVKFRQEFISVQYSITTKEYDTIFGYPEEGRQKAIELTEKYMHTNTSYIMTAYNIHLLTEYNKSLKSSKIRDNIAKLHSSNIQEYIQIDLIRLEKVFGIVLPEQEVLDKAVNDILAIQLLDREKIAIQNIENLNLNINIENNTVNLYKDLSVNISAKKHAIKELRANVDYQVKLQPYLQLYYTILELKIQDKYAIWISKFRYSSILDFYDRNIDINNRAIRWSTTLSSSIA